MRRAGFVAGLLGILLAFNVAQASVHQNPRAMEKRPVATGPRAATEQLETPPSLLSRLKALFPFGIQFFNWGGDTQNPPAVVATADCFQSVASGRCLGFDSLEQYVAAAHASRNLGIPFDKLKAKMATGKTLSQAIHELRPGTDYKTEARRAAEQAQKTLKDSAS